MHPGSGNPDVDRFDQWAPSYERSLAQRWYFDPIHDRMLDVLAQASQVRPSSILDIGCGTGRLLRDAGRRWPTAHLAGVDPAPKMIEEARRQGSRMDFHVGFAERLPYPDATMDSVLASLTFHHWAEQRRALDEVARVLKPGGWLCLADHAVWSFHRGQQVRSRRELETMLQRAGLELHRAIHMPFRFVLILLARRPPVPEMR